MSLFSCLFFFCISDTILSSYHCASLTSPAFLSICHLTLLQALADLASFRQFIVAQYEVTGKVIVFGGSYSGALVRCRDYVNNALIWGYHIQVDISLSMEFFAFFVCDDIDVQFLFNRYFFLDLSLLGASCTYAQLILPCRLHGSVSSTPTSLTAPLPQVSFHDLQRAFRSLDFFDQHMLCGQYTIQA